MILYSLSVAVQNTALFTDLRMDWVVLCSPFQSAATSLHQQPSSSSFSSASRVSSFWSSRPSCSGLRSIPSAPMRRWADFSLDQFRSILVAARVSGWSHETCLKVEAAWVTFSFLKSWRIFSFTLLLPITRKASSGQIASKIGMKLESVMMRCFYFLLLFRCSWAQ